MAIAVGSKVLMVSASADLPEGTDGPQFTSQPQLMGSVVADAGGGNWDVFLDSGVTAAAIPAGQLSELFDVSVNTRQAFWGRMCQIASESAEYIGEVVAMYRRGGVNNAERALLRLVNNSGAYREVFAGQLIAVGGR